MLSSNPNLVVFVTGGASGLGEATVRYLHKNGCKVSVADMDQERMNLLLKELGGDRLITFRCNVTIEEDIKQAIEGTVQQFGTIHVALACAGVAWPSMTLTSSSSLDMNIVRQVIDINLYGSIYVAKYASIVMSKNKAINEQGEKGVILFVSSVAAEEGQRGQVAYSATKGAINGMVMPMARDLGKYGIRVAAIAPGLFETPLSSKISQKIKERLNRDTPMGRPGHVNEFAHFVNAIIENSYINGVHLRIDGAAKFSHM